MDIHKKFFSKIGFTYLIYALTAIVMQIILINLVVVMNADILNDYNISTILLAFCNYVLPFPVLYYLMRKMKSEKLEKNSLSINTFLLYASITMTLMWIGNITGLAITSLIGVAAQTDISNPVQDLINNSSIWLNLTLISIIGPIFEEVIFRKLLIDRTIKYGARVSIILSAVLFGFFHGNLSQLFYASLLGGFFAYVYIKTGRVIYTIALHILVNLMGSVASLFVTQSAQALMSNAFSPQDLVIVVVYFLIVVLALLFGLIGLTMYKKGKFNGSKTQIPLKNPLKTVMINPGIICFILFHIGIIIYQLNLI